MSDATIARVQYFERQFLRREDFADEQAYHLAMRRRHNIAHHIWGIVFGLELAQDPDGNFVVRPGMAVDGYGRELVLAEQVVLSPTTIEQRLQDRLTDELDVWLGYDRLGSDPVPLGNVRCADGAERYYRWQEQPGILLEAPDLSQDDPRTPTTVPEGDWRFDPSRTPPDDPQQDWPVLLGRIARARVRPGQPPAYTIQESRRPYAGLVGEAIIAPSGRTRVQIGAEDPVDDRRFAVFVLEPGRAAEPLPLPGIEITDAGETTIRGATTIHGDLTIADGALEFGVGTAREPHGRPWQIYHQIERQIVDDPPPAGGAAGAAPGSPAALADQAAARSAGSASNAAGTGGQSGGPAGQPPPPTVVLVHELRIEMAAGSAGHNRVVIGTWSEEDGRFNPCLTVDDQCSVTVHGNLVVEGTLRESQSRPRPRISPQVQALAVSNALNALGNTGQAATVAVNPIDSELDIVARMLESPTGRVQVISVMRQNQETLALILDPTGLRDEVIRQLGALTAGVDVIASQLAATRDWNTGMARALAGDAAKQQQLATTLGGDQGLVDGFIEALILAQAAADMVGHLARDEASRTAMARGLAADDQGRTLMVTVLMERPEGLSAMVTTLARTPAGRTAMADRLARTPAGRTAMTTSLAASGDGRTAMTTSLAASDAGRTAMAQWLAGSPEGRAVMAQQMLAQAQGLRQFMESLEQAGAAKIQEFAEMLTPAGFPNLEAALRDKLCGGQ